jgi:hypothetical protein
MNALVSYAAIPREPLAAWAFDALEEIAHECGGIGGGRFERQSYAFDDERWLPCCITMMATVAAIRMGLRWNAIINEIARIGITPFVNDVAVAAICDAHGWPRTARVSWVEFIAEVGLVRADAIEAPVSPFALSSLTAPQSRAGVH